MKTTPRMPTTPAIVAALMSSHCDPHTAPEEFLVTAGPVQEIGVDGEPDGWLPEDEALDEALDASLEATQVPQQAPLGSGPLGGDPDVGEASDGPNDLSDEPPLPLAVSQTLPGAISLFVDIKDVTTPRPNAKTTGMLAAVVRGNHIVAIGHAGYSKYNTRQNYPDAIFNIGSNGKSMGALALSFLIEQEAALTWNTTLAEAAPFVTEWANNTGSATLRQLVDHKAGFVSVGCNIDRPSNWKSLTPVETLRQIARLVAKQCTAKTVGMYVYSNAGYTLAQTIVEYWAGVHLYDDIMSKFGKPWGMDGSILWTRPPELARSPSGFTGTAAQKNVWEPLFSHASDPLLASGHYMWSSKVNFTPYTLADPNVTSYGLNTASGNLAVNLQGWARYASNMMRSRSPAVRTIRDAALAAPSGYEFGWGTANFTTSGFAWSRMSHSGALGLGDSHARSYIRLYPQHDTAYLLYANGGPEPSEAIEEALANVLAHVPAGDDGCARSSSLKAVQHFYDQTMFGCAGSVEFADKEGLCGAGHHVCSAAEYHAKNAAVGEKPLYHYWTADALRRSAVGGTGNCSVHDDGSGVACQAIAAPMRVCTDTTTDSLGNTCNWQKCGYGDKDNEWFGGCSLEGHLDRNFAGTLCCAD